MDHLQSSDSSCTVGISPALLQAIAQTLSTAAATTGSTATTSLVTAAAGTPGLTTETAAQRLTQPIIAVKVCCLHIFALPLSPGWGGEYYVQSLCGSGSFCAVQGYI